MTMARVTAVVPTYNGSAYLEQALASVEAQTYGDWDAVVVDDGSSDDCHELARRFASRHPGRVQAIRLERNVGVAEARNTGIRAAGGELVALLDQDDYWREDYLERAVALYDDAVASGRRVGIVSANARIHGPDGPADVTWAQLAGWRDEIDYSAMLRHNYVVARALLPKAAWEEVGGFSEGCGGSDDYDLWLRMMEAGWEIVATREPLTFYRRHELSMSRDKVLMNDGAVVALRRALARGSQTRAQRRIARAAIRHHRALGVRAELAAALYERRLLRAARLSLQAVPTGVIAFVQRPGRWYEWIRRATRSGGGAAHHRLDIP